MIDMKKLATILGTVLIVCAPAFAQEAQEKSTKSYTGTDNDSKEYLIGAPIDNWFFAAGAGVQTYIGNEVVKSAKWNGINPAVYVEIGKWILPDLAVSLHLSGFNMSGQTRYTLNPFVDFTGIPAGADGYVPYQKFNALNFALNGFVTMDWTNLIYGYEKGGSKKVHLLTPVGLGCAWLNGKTINPRSNEIHVMGKQAGHSNNFELDFSVALIPEIYLSENVHLVPALRLQFERGSMDFTSYASEGGRFDFQPSATIGVRVNLSGTKGGKHQTRFHGDKDNLHVFVPVESSHTVDVIEGRVRTLAAEADGLKGDLAAAQKDLGDAQKGLDDAQKTIDALQDDIDALKAGADSRPLNAMEEILLGASTGELGSVMVWFPINEWTLDYNSKMKLDQFVQYVNNADEKKVFYIIGAADKATGNDKINDNLSINRCKAVYNYLVKQLGAYPGKFELRPLGGIDEWEKNELNRVGIVVESSDAMTAIVDKYSKKY